MKNIKYILILALSVPLFITSCLKEDIISDPVISDFKMYMEDVDGNDSIIADIFAGNQIKLAVYTDADIVSIWPGGIRQIQKKKNSEVDSIDMFGNPVLVKSDWFGDYGLIGARGYKTTGMESGWHTSYTYPSAGQFELTLVATNHGYDGFDPKRVIEEIEVTVREE